MKPILTISIAAYNAEKYLEKCLSSLIKCQRFNALQIIVVDDGSSDNTAEIGKSYAKRYPDQIRLISKANGGHGSTINTTIQLAEGKYYKIVDSDDWVESANIDVLVGYLESLDVSIVINPYYIVNADSGEKQIIKPFITNAPTDGQLICISQLYEYEYRHAMHSLTFNTSLVRQMGPIIDEKCFYVDAEYTIFPMKYAKSFVYYDFPIYDYLMGTNEQSMNETNMIRRRDQHLKVCKRVIDFYRGNHEIEEGIRSVIKRRVDSLICTEYIILMKNGNKQELLSFDEYMCTTSADLYASAMQYGIEQMHSNYISVLLKMKKNNFRLFPLYNTILRLNRLYKKLHKR